MDGWMESSWRQLHNFSVLFFQLLYMLPCDIVYHPPKTHRYLQNCPWSFGRHSPFWFHSTHSSILLQSCEYSHFPGYKLIFGCLTLMSQRNPSSFSLKTNWPSIGIRKLYTGGKMTHLTRCWHFVDVIPETCFASTAPQTLKFFLTWISSVYTFNIVEWNLPQFIDKLCPFMGQIYWTIMW